MIPLPAEVRRTLARTLPGSPHIKIICRDERYRLAPAYRATWYEIITYHMEMGRTLLELDMALTRTPGVQMVTMLTPAGGSNPDWPIRYADAHTFRPQVRALMKPGGHTPAPPAWPAGFMGISRDWRPGMIEFATIGVRPDGRWAVVEGRTTSGEPMQRTDDPVTVTAVTVFDLALGSAAASRYVAENGYR